MFFPVTSVDDELFGEFGDFDGGDAAEGDAAFLDERKHAVLDFDAVVVDGEAQK